MDYPNVSKKQRFEIFKRDNFTCQYCGKKSPEVILEIDHILPKKEGGKNYTYNLITACFDCNRGKSDRIITNKIARQDLHKDIVDLKEQIEQIKFFEDLETQKQLNQLKELESVIEYWYETSKYMERGSGYCIEKSFQKFLEFLTPNQIKKAIDITYSKPSSNYFKYFCGICWSWIKNPNV